jgi:Plasmid pRiA4b ORF-3-like protein
VPGDDGDRVTVHRLKVTLLYVDPPIWRRIQVRSRTSLAELHLILQWTMGWEDCHRHGFGVPRQRRWRKARLEPVREAEEAEATLDQFGVGVRLRYVYDFGDGWVHEIEVDDIRPVQDGVACPLCVDGARACPPEDCGGWVGYQEMLEALRSRRGPRYREVKQFLGGARFHPEAFSVAAVNRDLARFHQRPAPDAAGRAR